MCTYPKGTGKILYVPFTDEYRMFVDEQRIFPFIARRLRGCGKTGLQY
jgi:hypothetical protein